ALPDDAAFDLAFIDADKTGYLSYYEALLPRMRERGLILVDNTLWSRQVLPDHDNPNGHDGSDDQDRSDASAGNGPDAGLSGSAAEASGPDADTRALRAFNDAVAADHRVWSTIIPIGDGLTLIQRR
ncbi:MAG: O-methyltransferase, partial [Nocardioides sp.]